MDEEKRNLSNLAAHDSGLDKVFGALEQRVAAIEQSKAAKGLFNKGSKDQTAERQGKSWRESLFDRIKDIRERIGTNINELKAKLQHFPDTSIGKEALRSVREIIEVKPASQNIEKKQEAVLAAKFAAEYFINKGKAQITTLRNSIWEHKADIALGAATGVGLRTLLITAGWEAYVAKAVAAGGVAALRKGWAELESYDKPEGKIARINIIKRFNALSSEQKKTLGKKMLVAGAFGFGGSFLGMEFMEHTGMGDYFHQAMASGLDRAGEMFGGVGSKAQELLGQTGQFIQEKAAEIGKPQFELPKAEIPQAVPMPQEVSPEEIISAPPTVETIVTQPVVELQPQATISSDETLFHQEPLVEAETAAVPIVAENLLDEAVKNLPAQMPTPLSGGWGVSENLLKMLNPDMQFTAGDIMEVDKALCMANGVSVPEWDIQGVIDHRKLPADFQFKIDDNVKEALKKAALKAASR